MISALLFVVCLPAFVRGDDFAFFHENVLGTSLEIRINAKGQAAAREAESAGLREIDRLSSIYSHYDSESEFSRFVTTAVGSSVPVSAELASTLRLCDQWKSASHGAFNPAVEQLTSDWGQAASDGVHPGKERIAATLQKIRHSHWQIDEASGLITRTTDVPLSLNAIAKGVILDQVTRSLLGSSDNINGVMLNIGGDIRIAGNMSVKVAIADPRSDAIGSEGLSSLVVKDGAVATSGISERHLLVAGTRYSHIIDPRNGMPVSQMVSATVVAKDASTADAVATICNVLSVSDGLRLVDSLAGVECLLMSAAGVVATSVNWPGDDSPAEAGTDTPKDADEAKTKHEMLVEFEIAKSANSRRYRRPYVGVWIEDKDGFPVKTLSLFLMQNNPGPRWYRDLRRWYADDQMRKLVDDEDLIESVSKPTRNPGKYKVTWDGHDDGGKLLSPGQYTLLIEAAREHGSYQLIKHKFSLGNSFEVKLKPNEEISVADVRYVAK